MKGEALAASMGGPRDQINLDRVAALTPEVEEEVDRMFQYQPWDAEQITQGSMVRIVLAGAVKDILRYVPPCADRSAAIRKICEARMDCNSAITFRGQY